MNGLQIIRSLRRGDGDGRWRRRRALAAGILALTALASLGPVRSTSADVTLGNVTNDPTMVPDTPPDPGVADPALLTGATASTYCASPATAWGTVLVPGATWAPEYASKGDLNVYSNGSGCTDRYGTTYGIEYECVELAQRWAAIAYGDPNTWSHVDYAYEMWNVGPTLSPGFIQEPNGGSALPQHGDIVVFAAGTGEMSSGHVAVVAQYYAANQTSPGSPAHVVIVEQNWSSAHGMASLTMNGTTMVRPGTTILGWLHSKTATATSAPSPITVAVSTRKDGYSGYTMNSEGQLTAYGGAPALTGYSTWTWQIARGFAMCPGQDNFGYTLDGWGGVHPIGNAPPVIITGYWSGWDIARSIVLRQDCTSGFVLDGWGGIHAFGTATDLPADPQPGGYWPGWDIARSIAYAGVINNEESGYVMDGWGGIHPFGAAPAVTSGPYWPGWDVARNLVLGSIDGSNLLYTPCCSGYVLDAFGGLHPFNGAPAVTLPAYWSGQYVARGLSFNSTTGTGYYANQNGTVYQFNPVVPVRGAAVRGDGTSGYAIDGYGTLHPYGGAPPVTGVSTWNWDIARSVALCPGVDDDGYTLDGWGGVHPFGTAQPVTLSWYDSGVDIAKQILLRPDCQSGYVLDGYGVLHPFAVSALLMPPAPRISGQWTTDIARSAVLASSDLASPPSPAGTDSGYVLDGYGGLHPFGNAPSIGNGPYWSGWDIARGVVLSADSTPQTAVSLATQCCSGYVVDGWGGVHPFGVAPGVNLGAYWPGHDLARGITFAPGMTDSGQAMGQVVGMYGGIGTYSSAP